MFFFFAALLLIFARPSVIQFQIELSLMFRLLLIVVVLTVVVVEYFCIFVLLRENSRIFV